MSLSSIVLPLMKTKTTSLTRVMMIMRATGGRTMTTHSTCCKTSRSSKTKTTMKSTILSAQQYVIDTIIPIGSSVLASSSVQSTFFDSPSRFKLPSSYTTTNTNTNTNTSNSSTLSRICCIYGSSTPLLVSSLLSLSLATTSRPSFRKFSTTSRTCVANKKNDNNNNNNNDNTTTSTILVQPTYYRPRSERMDSTNGIPTDVYNRMVRKNRSAPTRDLNYTAEMWKEHKSPWRHLLSTQIWYDSAFQRLIFPDLTIITGIALCLSAFTIDVQLGPDIGYFGPDFIWAVEVLEKETESMTRVMGTCVLLLLGYRVNTTYDRYCNARKMWGEITNSSRDLARNVCMYIPTNQNQGIDIDDNNNNAAADTATATTTTTGSSSNSSLISLEINKQRLLNLIRMYPIALHFFLTTKGSHHMIRRKDPEFQQQVFVEYRAECIDFWKEEKDSDDDGSRIDPDLIRIFDAYNEGKHVPLLILNMMGESLAELSMIRDSNDDDDDTHDYDNGGGRRRRRRGEIIMNPIYINEMDRQIQRMTSGPCERLLRTPMPTAFTRYTSRMTILWAYSLPFGLISDFGPYCNPLGSVFLAYCVMAIDDIGIQLEEPFNILPQRQYSDGIIDSVNLIESSFIMSSNNNNNSKQPTSILKSSLVQTDHAPIQKQ